MQEPMDAEFEMQRIQKAVLTAFLCLLKKIRGPHKVHVDNKEKNRSALERRKEMHQSESW